MVFKIYALIVAVVSILNALSAYLKVIDPALGIFISSISVAVLAWAEYLRQEGVIGAPRRR